MSQSEIMSLVRIRLSGKWFGQVLTNGEQLREHNVHLHKISHNTEMLYYVRYFLVFCFLAGVF